MSMMAVNRSHHSCLRCSLAKQTALCRTKVREVRYGLRWLLVLLRETGWRALGPLSPAVHLRDKSKITISSMSTAQS